MKRKLLVLPALMGIIGPAALAGCGGSGGSGSDGESIIVGTTDSFTLSKDTPAPLDPATSYENSSWNIFYNTFQMLLRYPRNGTTPEPDAAKSCKFTDHQSETYRCTLRNGLTFSNGHALTAEDVKYSVDRMLKINSDIGPASLMAGVRQVETPDDKTVVFDLKASDATFPFKLATPAAAIVDHQVYPADKPYTGFRIVGSGPYKLDSFDKDTKAVFSANTSYQGSVSRSNSKIELDFFKDSAKLYSALADGSVDVTTSLKAAQINTLLQKQTKTVKLTETPGTQVKYLFFNTSDAALKPKAVRVAIAQLLDRSALARDVYKRTVDPLYSVVPQGITGHKNSFYNVYGDVSASAAASALSNAGITTPVKFTFWYRDSGGSSAIEESKWLQKQLNGSGLFDVTIKQAPVDTFVGSAIKGKFAAYGLGWVPDFPDSDNYVAPFFGDNFLHLQYVSNQIRSTLLPRTRQKADRTATNSDFETMQDIVAQDIPLIPLWQAKQYIAARENVTGAEWALNSTSTIQFWELGKA
jgi:peptide/nickel transport system substrate-binding protein